MSPSNTNDIHDDAQMSVTNEGGVLRSKGHLLSSILLTQS